MKPVVGTRVQINARHYKTALRGLRGTVLDDNSSAIPGEVKVGLDEGAIVFAFPNELDVLSETADAMQPYGATGKPTNPKDAVGSDKLPLHLWPETATVMGTLGMLDGMLKYGRANWRSAGIRASIYADAIKRHVNAWFEGEDLDPDSGVPHLAHILACAAIIVDAQAAGNLTDDRQYSGGYRGLIDELTPHVARLKEKHADKSPKHWTIADA